MIVKIMMAGPCVPFTVQPLGAAVLLYDLIQGRDGNLWFTVDGPGGASSNAIGQITNRRRQLFILHAKQSEYSTGCCPRIGLVLLPGSPKKSPANKIGRLSVTTALTRLDGRYHKRRVRRSDQFDRVASPRR